MRVLIIANNFPEPGQPQPGIFILRQIQALAKLGWHARVLRFTPWAPAAFGRWKQYLHVPSTYAYDGVEVFVTRVLLLPRFGLMEHMGLQTRRFVDGHVREFDPDVIHAHQLLPTGLMAIHHGRPAVVTAHGSDTYNYPYRNSAFRKAAKMVAASADQVVAVSRFIAKHVAGFGARNVEVVFNGADPRVFFPMDRAAARSKLSVAEDRNVLVFAGAIVETKGIFDLSEALQTLRDLKPLLFLAGTGTEKDALHDRLKSAGVEHRFYGSLSHEDLAVLMNAADAVTLPSHREGLPTVVCEAMLVGRIVVTTSVGGIPEIVTNRETGYIVPPNQPDMLAAALRAALTDTAGRNAMEEKARGFALAHLTWDANADAYDRIYRRTIQRPAERAPRPADVDSAVSAP